MPSSIETEVIRLVAEVTHCPLAEVTPSSRFIEDLEANSLDVVELACLAEEYFGKKIPDSALPQFRTVSDVINYLAVD